MPNWATTRLVISGNKESLDELQAQMSTPYETEYYSYKDNSVETETYNGVFLLWNAIRPIDLDAYYERAKTQERIAERNKPVENEIKMSPEQVLEKLKDAIAKMPIPDSEQIQIDMAKIVNELATGMGWYEWNCRNWGTKWEITDNASVESRTDNELVYFMTSAWSPPDNAIDSLAKQYPNLVFTLKSIDEGYCFAVEIGWADGERAYEMDLPITHEIKVELEGYCHLCDPDEGYLGDPDYDEYRAELGCLESATAGIEAENV